jgi:hypothetical protein
MDTTIYKYAKSIHYKQSAQILMKQYRQQYRLNKASKRLTGSALSKIKRYPCLCPQINQRRAAVALAGKHHWYLLLSLLTF